jgi:predicted transcriptional regulator
MEPLDDRGRPISQPTLEELLGTVFDMTEAELDICLCVMEGGERTVKELAEQIAYDRSVIARHLNHLVELGVLEKRRRILKQGGQVYVYAPVDPAEIRRNFSVLFLQWVQEASALIEALRREKVEAIVEADSSEPEWKIYRRE